MLKYIYKQNCETDSFLFFRSFIIPSYLGNCQLFVKCPYFGKNFKCKFKDIFCYIESTAFIFCCFPLVFDNNYSSGQKSFIQLSNSKDSLLLFRFLHTKLHGNVDCLLTSPQLKTDFSEWLVEGNK